MFFCQKLGLFLRGQAIEVEILLPRLRRGKRLQRKARSRQKFGEEKHGRIFWRYGPKKNSLLKQGIFLFCKNLLRMQIARVGVTFFTIGSANFPPFIGSLFY